MGPHREPNPDLNRKVEENYRIKNPPLSQISGELLQGERTIYRGVWADFGDFFVPAKFQPLFRRVHPSIRQLHKNIQAGIPVAPPSFGAKKNF